MMTVMNVIDRSFYFAVVQFGVMATTILAGVMALPSEAYAQETGVKSRQSGAKQLAEKPTETLYLNLLDTAEALVKAGKPAAAYVMLEPLEFEHAGEPRYDYLIGIAALDSGKPDRATLALERALAVNPGFTAARLDIARAYFQLGDLLRAKTEFTAVLKQDPGADARANIEKYLAEIADQEGGKKLFFSGYVEAAVGHDSNVNYSTDQSQIFVDYYGASYPLDPASLKTPDSYYGVSSGGEVTYRLNGNWGWYAGVDMRKRANSTQQSFDSLNLDGRSGVKFDARADHWRVGVLASRYNLGSVHYSDTSGADAEWSHEFSPSNQLKLFVQLAKYRFVDMVMQVNDYDQQVAGAGWLHVLADGKTTLFGSLYSGTENEVSTLITQATPTGGRSDGAKRFNGMRVGGQTAALGKATLYANAGMQLGDYSKENVYFQRLRKDRVLDVTLGAKKHWGKLWTLRPQLSYTRNDSNIAIYEYDRTDVSVTIRRDFR